MSFSPPIDPTFSKHQQLNSNRKLQISYHLNLPLVHIMKKSSLASIPSSFLDLPREIRQKILKQTFNPQIESGPRPTPQVLLYPEECMNSHWNPIKVPDRAEKLTAEMRCVEDWVETSNRKMERGPGQRGCLG